MDWSTTSPVYIRLRAVNAAGTSLPSPVVVSQRAGTAPRVLLVDSSHTMDGSLNLRQTETFGHAPENQRTVQRVRPLHLLESHRTVRLGRALHELGHPFDMASPGDLAAGRLDMARYKAIIYDSGSALPDFQPMPSAVAASLNRYVAQGGRVIATGAWLAQAVTLDGADGARLLRTAFAAQTLASPVETARGVVPVEGARGLLPVEDQQGLVGPVFPAGALVPTNAGREVLRWSATRTGAAAVAGPGGVIASVSPASLDQPADRRDLLEILITSAGAGR
jgi:hypothetical protein